MAFELIVIAIAVLISIPLIVVGTECLVALFFNTPSPPKADTIEKSISYKILIPAHNEADIISKTLVKLIAQLPDPNPENIVLVADNCTDNTASIAKALDVTVLERQDSTQRGKGFALDFGIQYLKGNHHPDVLVIMDADCETTKAALISLINSVVISKLPAQMTYLMRVIMNASIKQKISGFAWLLKNQVRLSAMNKMGLPVTLTGTGMAFPWQALETVKVGHGNIVEDMQLGIDCAINGFPSVFCPDAVVYSDFPEQSAAELSQRTRWEHGHLQTIFQQLPLLIKASWYQKNWRLFALALDIGVPPLSLLVLIALSGLFALSVLLLVTETATAFFILVLSFSYFAAMLASVWWRYGQDYLSAKELSGIPLYVISKLSIYIAFIFKRQKEWIRTDRDA
ncbi:glycosyltransferase family 2 protein [Methyloglobulus sp.]|uniref:glycosyltransferase family 2 protein n=1 Tax=Methyloglobulus sp. TaxID=2518622 RepID=UPI0032B854D0